MTAQDDLDEATQARGLAARLRALDFAESDPPSGLRELERALERFASAARGPEGEAARGNAWGAIASSVEALAVALESEQRARAIDRMRLTEGLRWVSDGAAESGRRAARVTELEQELQSRDAKVAGLEGEVRSRDATIAAASAEAQQLAGRMAALESELAQMREEVGERERLTAEGAARMAQLQAELAQPGHRLVARAGAMLARHPRIGAAMSAIARRLNRLLDRSGS